jgi:hypothetical protein
MGELQVHANEVRQCKGCYSRIVWLQSAYGKRSPFNVPDSERGKSWISIGDRDFHDCPRKEWLDLLKKGRKYSDRKLICPMPW